MRATKATVHLGAISQNLKSAMKLAGSSKAMPVIKANAYGHGALEVARKLETFHASRVPAFAVAFMDEAVRLREAGIERPIMVLQGSSQAGDVAEAAARNFWLMLHSPEQVERVVQSNTPRPVRVWLKADTGMHRLGLNGAELEKSVNALKASQKVQAGTVLCSHLACADELDSPVTHQQMQQLKQWIQQYQLPWSMANSAGIIGWPQSHGDWVRPGYMLYGNDPLLQQAKHHAGQKVVPAQGYSAMAGQVGASGQQAINLKPAMTMTAEIIAIHDIAAGEAVGYGHDWVASEATTLGIVSIGFADGYPRHATSGTPVWVNGQRAALAGRVSMDMIAIDLAGIKQVAVGDEVELWGKNLSVNEVAACSDTIGYEILAGLSGRAPISYLP